MKTKLENWNNGWFGVELGIKRNEIDRLIGLLEMLKNDPDQHFHISSEYKGDGGLGDIEVYVQEESEESNMITMGKALAPGTEINKADA